MSKDTGGPAFPREDYQVNGHERGFENLGQEGMSLRDYFAASAMQGIASAPYSVEFLAEKAYSIADAMIKVRNQ